MKKVSLIALALCIVLPLSACTDYKSQIEELQTNLVEMEEKISELESEIIDYENQLKDATGTIAQQEATIDDLNEQLSEATESSNEPNIPPDNSKYVYVTKTGTKYHRPWCSYLGKTVFYMTPEDAIASGYTPCSRCY